MDVGMLWFDSDHQRDVHARIERASAYYQSKYGRKPNLCFIHPAASSDGTPKEVEGLRILTSAMVLPNHFWLGIEKAEGG